MTLLLHIMSLDVILPSMQRMQRPPNQTRDKCQWRQYSINMSFSDEDNIGDHLEDDVVKEALESGQDLREYSRCDN